MGAIEGTFKATDSHAPMLAADPCALMRLKREGDIAVSSPAGNTGSCGDRDVSIRPVKAAAAKIIAWVGVRP
jgi:hypothetical protein